jgi:hypothetical protein
LGLTSKIPKRRFRLKYYQDLSQASRDIPKSTQSGKENLNKDTPSPKPRAPSSQETPRDHRQELEIIHKVNHPS